jgi:hypothetical protein
LTGIKVDLKRCEAIDGAVQRPRKVIHVSCFTSIWVAGTMVGRHGSPRELAQNSEPIERGYSACLSHTANWKQNAVCDKRLM